MKLRLIMGGCALAAAALGAGSVVVTGQNICGLMNVPSTTTYTMIAVPWVTVGNSSEEATMKVANLVKTDTLTAGDETTAGDELYYYDGTAYFRWVLKTVDGKRAWTPTATTLKDAKGADVTVTAPDEGYALNRGKGLFLVRQNTAAEIWLYGQYDASAVSVAVTAGTTLSPAYTMIANPNATDYDLNGTDTKVTGAVGDQILLGDGGVTLYTYKANGWTKTTTVKKTINGVERTFKSDTTEGVTIPAGTGAWYVSKGGSLTIAW